MRDYETTIDPDTLATVITMPTAEKVARDVQATIANDHDGKVVAALMALGWTPPHDHRDVNDAVRKAEDHAGMWCLRDLDGGLEGSSVPEMLAAEVRRLRVLFHVNLLRHAPSASHADIDAILYPTLPEQAV